MPETTEHRVTELLAAVGGGDRAAADELLDLVYDRLRALAHRRMAEEAPGGTLQATALVHEAYMRLLGEGGSPDFESRGHFFGAAAEAMRRILVDQARRRGSRKRGGDRDRVPLADDVAITPPDETLDVLSLDDAIEGLKARDPAMYDIAMLRHFCGLTTEQTARVVGRSPRSIRRDWAVAKLWLTEAMEQRDA